MKKSLIFLFLLIPSIIFPQAPVFKEQIAGKTISFPTPNGFVEVYKQFPDHVAVTEMKAQKSNTLLLFFVPIDDSVYFLKNEPIELRTFLAIQRFTNESMSRTNDKAFQELYEYLSKNLIDLSAKSLKDWNERLSEIYNSSDYQLGAMIPIGIAFHDKNSICQISLGSIKILQGSIEKIIPRVAVSLILNFNGIVSQILFVSNYESNDNISNIINFLKAYKESTTVLN